MASSQATTSEVSAIAHWNTKIYLKSQKKKAGKKKYNNQSGYSSHGSGNIFSLG